MVPQGLTAQDQRKLYRDMYEGDGPNNKSMTTRMALMEGDMEEIKLSIANLTKLFKSVWWMLLVAIVTAAVDAAAHGIFKH